MKMKFTLIVAALLLVQTHRSATASNFGTNEKDPYVKTFITNTHRLPDKAYQQQLKNSDTWKNFLASHGSWSVRFNEETGLPHLAFGKPISMNVGSDPKEIATAFLADELNRFAIPANELVYRNTATNQKYHYVNYKQFHNGLEVLWANTQIKMTLDGRVMLFGLDVYNDIAISNTPALNAQAAMNAAVAGVNLTITNTSVNPDLKILPVPAVRKNEYHLVYEVTVKAKDNDNIPAEYYTLVDANSGEVLYRHNNVYAISSNNTDVNVTATLYPTTLLNPLSVEPLKYLRVVVDGTTFNTDNTGYLGLSNILSSSATLSLQGLWSRVRTGSTTPTWSTTLFPGQNNVSFDTHANVKELSAYHSVNEIHDYYKSKATGNPTIENTMDFVMQTNIDVAGTCNAVYTGAVNFFDAGGGCNATSLIADVVYHEYGHGINSLVYSDYGAFGMGNGALNEAYADTWANGRTENPILGPGFFTNGGSVRRYDINKKVYPQDLVGEVHADGEIIAGCWWDTGLNFGDIQARQELFLMTFAATRDAVDGQEGQLYEDVLVEALTDDDNDGDLTNGTPRYCEITSAFRIHGIEISSGVELQYTPLAAAAANVAIPVSVTASSAPLGGFINCHYKLNNSTTWNLTQLTSAGGNVFTGNIPAQPAGTIVGYFFTDFCSDFGAVVPAEANDPVNPNLPEFVLVGFDLLNSNDFETTTAGWQTNLAGDNATSGKWVADVPGGTVAVAVDPNPTFLPSTSTNMVQTGDDHSAVGSNCFVTGNIAATSSTADDVDNGMTSLQSSVYDLSTYTNPAFTYWRFFSNDKSSAAGSGLDVWRVQISNDGGATFTPVESTITDDHSWRRMAFRVSDYVTPTANVVLKFIAEDAPPEGIVEAALDDVELWDVVPTGVNENQTVAALLVYPNPASGDLTVKWNQLKQENVSVTVTDNVGRVVLSLPSVVRTGMQKINVPVSGLANGVYFVKLSGENTSVVKKINIMK